MRKLFAAFFYVGISIQVGCAATAYLRSDRALRSSFDKNASIYVKASETMSIDEANFMVMLEEGIKKSGLKIAENPSKADYILKFGISEPVLLSQTFYYEPVVTTPYGGREWPVSYYPVSYLYGYPGLKITVTLFKKENFLKSPHIPLWEASLMVKKELYPEHGDELIKIILDHIGQRFEGRVELP